MTQIHPTAIIEDGATIGQEVTIGAYCVVGKHVTLHDKVHLKSHVVVDGYTTIGESTTIYPFASIGHIPQDLKFKGEKSTLEIGSHNTIREHVTINPGTEGGGLVTRIGDHNLLMVGVHVAHDCIVGSHVVLANNATLAGHVHLGDYCVIGGLAAIHQFVRIGHHAMIGGMSGIENDVIPYGQAMGERAGLTGLNLIGLKRKGFERDGINTMRAAFKTIFSKEGTFIERLNAASSHYKNNHDVMEIINFIQDDSSRAICQPKNG